MVVLVFDKSRVEKCLLDDGHGGRVGLMNHLRYISEESGSPDGDVANLKDFEDAEHFFSNYPEHNSVYADYYYSEELTKDEINEYFGDR